MDCHLLFKIKRIISVVFSILAAAMLTSPAAAQEEILTVLEIDGAPYSINLVGSMINQLPENIRSRPVESYYDDIIDDIIDTRLAAKAAIESGLEDNALVKEIADRAYDRVMAEAWINQIVSERITDEMIEQGYNDFVADTENRTEVRARHILLSTKEAANAVIARLDNKEDFAEIAKDVSIGPSGPDGGELSYFRRGSMVPAFEVAAFATPKGTYTTTPVQTQFGWHVIMVEDRRVTEAPPLQSIRQQLVSRISAGMVDEMITELRSNVNIERLSFEEVREAETKRLGNAAQ